MYSLDGKLLGSYDSIKEAARELEISESTIRKNLDLNRKAGNKLFVLKGESFEDKKKAMETHRYIDGRRKITRFSLGIKEYTIMVPLLHIGVLNLKQLKPMVSEHMIYQDA